MLMDFVRPKILKSNGVADRLTGRLHGEELFGVSQVHSLSVNSTDRDTPVVWVRVGKLWNVVGHLARSALFAFQKNLFYLILEGLKFRNNKVFRHRLLNNAEIVFDDGEELLLAQLDFIERLDLLDHVLDSWIVRQNSVALNLLHELSFVDHVRILIL